MGFAKVLKCGPICCLSDDDGGGEQGPHSVPQPVSATRRADTRARVPVPRVPAQPALGAPPASARKAPPRHWPRVTVPGTRTSACDDEK